MAAYDPHKQSTKPLVKVIPSVGYFADGCHIIRKSFLNLGVSRYANNMA
jgi:hypothetical protein